MKVKQYKNQKVKTAGRRQVDSAKLSFAEMSLFFIPKPSFLSSLTSASSSPPAFFPFFLTLPTFFYFSPSLLSLLPFAPCLSFLLFSLSFPFFPQLFFLFASFTAHWKGLWRPTEINKRDNRKSLEHCLPPDISWWLKHGPFWWKWTVSCLCFEIFFLGGGAQTSLNFETKV